MISLTINGLPVSVEKGSTLLEAATFLGFPIPTLCHMEGLTPYGACRICVVEIGEGERSKLVSSCTYLAEEGLKVRTTSVRVLRARKMVLELLLASCPQSKTIQDLASKHDVRQQRFKQEYEDCILCGRCVRMCKEQMVAEAIGFRGRVKTAVLARLSILNQMSAGYAGAVSTSVRPVSCDVRTTNPKKPFVEGVPI